MKNSNDDRIYETKKSILGIFIVGTLGTIIALYFYFDLILAADLQYDLSLANGQERNTSFIIIAEISAFIMQSRAIYFLYINNYKKSRSACYTTLFLFLFEATHDAFGIPFDLYIEIMPIKQIPFTFRIIIGFFITNEISKIYKKTKS